MMRIKLTIRTKLLLLSIAVLSIPYIGMEFLRELERYLRDSLEISLTDATRATAGSLHGKDWLFPMRADNDLRTLYVHNLNLPIQLDGYTDDWNAYLDWSEVYRAEGSNLPNEDPISYRLILSQYEQYYYALLQVNDTHLVYQNSASPDSLNNDHVQLVFAGPDGQLAHFYFSLLSPGGIRPFSFKTHRTEFGFEQRSIDYATTINGEWQPSDQGYNLEIAIPKNLVGNVLGFVVADVDDSDSRDIESSLGTAGDTTKKNPGRLMRESALIKQIIVAQAEMDGRRIWVLDNRGGVLATSGSLDKKTSDESVSFLYRFILPSVFNRFHDDLEGASRLQGEEVMQALAGKNESRWRTSPDGRAVIVSAATPVWNGDQVRGVVVVEETTNSIQMLQRQAMASLFNKTILVFIAVTLLLLAFATRLSYRLRALSKESADAIDEHGRVMASFTASQVRDEIGDLSRNYAAMLERLKQYNEYLEGMAGKLSHELRTPIAVVQSSLEHLKEIGAAEESRIYLERAKEGTERLNLIVIRLSEATRLEQALQNAKKESTDIKRLISSCIEGYRLAFPGQGFELELPGADCIRQVVPDLLVQMLDKLVNNAIDFSAANRPIVIKLSSGQGIWSVSVINFGSSVPDVMDEQLFNSMVSMRDKRGKGEPHLGLGLYIVRLIAEYHGACVKATNLEKEAGVSFDVIFSQ